MDIPSYKNKIFIVGDNDTRIRKANDLSQFETFQSNDPLPVGSKVGDFKRVPNRTEVKITGAQTIPDKTVFVFIEPTSNNQNLPSGWTKAANLEGRFMNEIISFAPADWDSIPVGNNFTVTDKNSLIREGSPGFASTGKTIPAGTYVVVTDKSKNPDGKYVKISEASISNGKATAGKEIGWTAANNLSEGCGSFFTGNTWLDQKGPNACWQGGNFIGAKVLVNIVGVGAEIEQITLNSLEPYFKLIEKAAKKNITIAIESGFRTYKHQEQLYDLYIQGNGNLAAKPGKSNHQHGQAFDLNTRGFDGSPVYDWLKKNGPKLGFIRTVDEEHWHWEYRPSEATAIADAGGFATPNVKK